MTHTKGPWRVLSRVVWHIGPEPGYSVAKALRVADASNDSMWTEERREANARLIAAAPELLEALRGIVDWDRKTPTDPKREVMLWSELISFAEATIAKAETLYPRG